MKMLDYVVSLVSQWTPSALRWIDSATGCDMPGANPDCRAWHWAIGQLYANPTRAWVLVGGLSVVHQAGPLAYERFRFWLAKRKLYARTARFIDPWEAYRQGFFRGQGFYLGDLYGKYGRLVRSVCVPGVASIMTFGGAGRQKGSGILIPNVLRYAFQVCVDFSGEIAATTKAELERRGYKVVCINPSGLHMDAPQCLGQARFDPLVGIDPTSKRFGALVRALVDAMILKTGKESEPHWVNSATAAVDFRTREEIRSAHAQGRKPSFLNVILSLTGDGEALKDVLRRMAASTEDKFIQSEGAGMLTRMEKSPKEFSSIVSNISAQLAWAKNATMEASLSGHDVDYEDLAGRGKHKGYVVFIILPLDDAESLAPWMRMVLHTIISAMIRRRPKHRILFTVDETAVLGGWVKLKHGLANLRKFKMQFHLIYHSLGEIKELFGESHHSMMANCFIKNFVGVNDAYTAQELSRLIGENERFDDQANIIRTPLARPEDILTFGDQAQISLVGASRPIFICNRPYFHRPIMRRGLTQNPFYQASEYPKIPSLYPVWWCLGRAVTVWAMMRPVASELALGGIILGGVGWSISH